MNYLGMIGPWQIIILSFVFLNLIPSIIALIDILKSKFNGNDKTIWIVVVLLFGLLGALLYFTIGRKQKISH